MSFQTIPGVPHCLVSATSRCIQDGVISEVLKTSEANCSEECFFRSHHCAHWHALSWFTPVALFTHNPCCVTELTKRTHSPATGQDSHLTGRGAQCERNCGKCWKSLEGNVGILLKPPFSFYSSVQRYEETKHLGKLVRV